MNILKQLRKPYAALLMATIILFTSCDRYEDETLLIETQKEYTGQELFKGIFFGEGEISKQLPSYEFFEKINKQLSKEEKEHLKNFQNDLITEIQTTNPEYFVSLKEAVDSKNNVRIRKQLKHAGPILRNATETLTQVSYAKIEQQIMKHKNEIVVDLDNLNELKSQQVFKDMFGKNQKNGDPAESNTAGIFIWAIAVATHIVAVTAVSAVIAIAIVTVDVLVGDDEEDDDNGSFGLRNEELVNSISEINGGK